MKLLVDSGSTKAKWLYSDGRALLTEGINPMHQSEDEIIEIISRVDFTGVDTICFYGAGCAEMQTNEPLVRMLRRASGAARVTVESDIVGAALFTLGPKPGIACILGTGANSVLWDGSRVVGNVHAGGFILGDEGSGARLGRALISDYIKGLTPEWMTDILRREHGLTYYNIIDRVYRQELPNRWLASWALLLGEHRATEYVHELLMRQFDLFLKRNICRYPGWQQAETGFTGSIAYHFEDELREAGAKYDIRFGRILKTPF